jgi:hypothetical protein
MFRCPASTRTRVYALRNKRSEIVGELAIHQQECDRLCSEIIHLDAVL